jgi:hypothetical protein
MSGLRWFAGGTDFSYFFTAGTDFVDSQSTPHPVVTMEGQGYDGQFFYRLAMDPFNWDKTANGVTIDYPSYRVQRIGYPFLAWLFSFGGIPVMVPFALWLVNLLSFAGIIYYFKRIAEKFRADSWFHFVPLLVCGIYMSVAKSLSEVTELFFFLAAFHAILDKRMVLFACFGSAAVLTRETAVIPMVALSVVFFFQYSDDGKVRSRLLAAVPLMMLICWKLFLAFVFRDEPAPPSLGNFTWPFKGIADGFMANMNFTSRFYALQSAFWLMYFIWQTWFSLLVFKANHTQATLRISLGGIFCVADLFCFLFRSHLRRRLVVCEGACPDEHSGLRGDGRFQANFEPVFCTVQHHDGCPDCDQDDFKTLKILIIKRLRL